MRNTPEIIQTILTQAKQPINQLQLKKRVKISPQQFKKYTEKLEKQGLITTTKKGIQKIYQTTQKGLETRNKLYKANQTNKQIIQNILEKNKTRILLILLSTTLLTMTACELNPLKWDWHFTKASFIPIIIGIVGFILYIIIKAYTQPVRRYR